MSTWTLIDIRNEPEIVKNIRWDLTPEKIFAPREMRSEADLERIEQENREQAGYYFYIDVWNMKASLALMHVKPDGSMTSVRLLTFWEEALIKAVEEAEGAINLSGHYPVNAQIKKMIRFWIPAIKD